MIYTFPLFIYFCMLHQEENGDYTYVERIRVPLGHGTLLLMSGATQDDWQVGSTNQMLRPFLFKPSTLMDKLHTVLCGKKP